jgi:Flp pilus assembly protein TadD
VASTLARGGRLLVASVLALVLVSAVLGGPVVQAQQLPVAPAKPGPADRLQLAQLASGPSAPGAPPGAIHFDAYFDYELNSVPRAFLLLFLFEDATQISTQDTSGALWVPPGSGQVKLEIDYVPKGGVEAITLLAALFREDESMLVWAGTTPISLRPWPARAAFESALGARLAGDYAQALPHLDRAIELSPETGQFYYWRADTYARLEQHGRAIDDFSRALERLPGDRASLTGRGVSRLWAGDWQSAVSDLSQVIDQRVTPDKWTAWAHRARGIAYASLGEAALAIADYRAYLRLAPNAADRAQIERWIEELS